VQYLAHGRKRITLGRTLRRPFESRTSVIG